MSLISQYGMRLIGVVREKGGLNVKKILNAVESVEEQMIQGLVKKAESEKLSVAPFIGIACPGIIEADGSIRRGAQNLPGKWDSEHFLLPERIRSAIASTNLSWMPAVTIRRLEAVQRWPVE